MTTGMELYGTLDTLPGTREFVVATEGAASITLARRSPTAKSAAWITASSSSR